MRFNTTVCVFAIILLMKIAEAEQHTLQHYCTTDAPEEVSAPTLKVLTLNISHGRNTSANQLLVSKAQTFSNLDAIAKLFDESGADVIGVQEADAPSRWSGTFDHVRYLAENSRYPCVAHGLHSESWISDYGTALFSRAAFSDPHSVRFPPSPPSKQKGYVVGKVHWQPDAHTSVVVNVVSVHLDFLRKSTRDVQIGTLVANLETITGALIILGDLNSEWSDSRSHVQALAEGLGLQAYEPGSDSLGTYKTTTGKRLDWILASPDLAFVNYEVLPAVVADHFAVFAEFKYAEGAR